MKLSVDRKGTNAVREIPLPKDVRGFKGRATQESCIGFDGGQLTERVWRFPWAIVYYWQLLCDRPVRCKLSESTGGMVMQCHFQGDPLGRAFDKEKKRLGNYMYKIYHARKSRHVYEFRSGEHEGLHISFGGQFAEEIIALCPTIRMHGNPPTVAIDHMAWHIVLELLSTDHGELLHKLKAKKCLYQLVYAYARALEKWEQKRSGPKSFPREALMKKILDHIQREANIKACTIWRLTGQFHISATSLKKEFLSFNSKTIGRTVRELAMEKAIHLLKETGMGIDEIAEGCGYGYTSNFVRAFRKRFGQMPMMLRSPVKARFDAK